MIAFLKRLRWVVLLASYIVVVRVCRIFRVVLPMDSFFHPHNLRRFRPYYVVPRTGFYAQIPPQRGR